MNLPDILKAYRKRHKLAQKQMAGAIGISRVHYSCIETGMRAPSLALLHRIESAFGITMTFVDPESLVRRGAVTQIG